MVGRLYLEHLSDTDLALLGAAAEARDDVRRDPDNLEALIECASRKLHRHARVGLTGPSLLRVYLRHEQHLGLVQSRLDRWVGSEVPKLFLRADICRRGLLLEIEGLCEGTQG